MSAETEARIGELLSQMTLEEKAALCHAGSAFCSGGAPRLGIAGLSMSDGPHGVAPEWRNFGARDADVDDRMTGLPADICLAATWNRRAAHAYGRVLGAEARARGKDVILGPGLNLRRTPVCGRNFEYFGEDPFLIGAMVAAEVRGIQEAGTAACPKHYACNNHEIGRSSVDVIVDERTLREIYLPGFEAAVREGGAWTVMASYNKLRGQHCCHNHHLLKQVLKQEWGFRGAVITDWGGCHDTFEAATCGLDLEMGTGTDPAKAYLGEAYLAGLRAGHFSIAELDDKVRRVLRVMHGIGLFDPDRPAGAVNTPAHRRVARDVAAEGMVLLKNDGGLLPLDVRGIGTLAVIGDNATVGHCEGGGSSGVKPFEEITPLAAIIARLGDRVRILHERGYPDLDAALVPVPPEHMGPTGQAGALRGWVMDWWGCRAGPVHDAPARSQTVPTIAFSSPDPPREDFRPHDYGMRWTGEFTPPENGTYEFILYGMECGLSIDDEYRCGSWDVGTPFLATTRIAMEAGRTYALRVMAFPGSAGVVVRLGWRPPWQPAEAKGAVFERAVAAARQADVVLLLGGRNHGQENEGNDLPDLRLPTGQDALIEALAEANPKTVVVLFGSGAVEMPWIGSVPAVVQAWYPGVEGGSALVDVLTGSVNPSGKLPCTMPVRLADIPAHSLGDYDPRRCVYREGVLVGYRYFDHAGVAPLFAFGHGLSYTRFDYADLRVTTRGRGGQFEARVSFDVTNVGDRRGAEATQVYVRDEASTVLRPPRELKGFDKVELAPGETRRLEVPLDYRALAFYDAVGGRWLAEPGEFTVEVGASSRDIRLTASLRYEG